mgnify:CR=1 FL=1
MRKDAGFTLVEIMIVLVILASLAAILSQTVIGGLDKARVNEAKLQMSQFGKALDMYNIDCGRFPNTEEGLAALAPGGESTCSSWGPEPYARKIPKDPWGNDYVYESDGGEYTITSFGKKGKPVGKDYEEDIVYPEE